MRHNFSFVIPAQAGIQWAVVKTGRWMRCLDSRLRGNDDALYAQIDMNFMEVPG